LSLLEIVIGECGWPTQGDQDATTANAQIFNQNLINHCKSGAGTPRNPDKPIRCFVFEMYDENQKDTGPVSYFPEPAFASSYTLVAWAM
jgi:exo-beta-1,3-glucanase (GH17 family)